MASRNRPPSLRSTVAAPGRMGPGANQRMSSAGCVQAAKARLRGVLMILLNCRVRYSLIIFLPRGVGPERPVGCSRMAGNRPATRRLRGGQARGDGGQGERVGVGEVAHRFFSGGYIA